MADYFTLSEARLAAYSSGNFTSVNKRLEEAASAESWRTFDVFLSHSMQDAEAVLGIKSILEGQSLTVYVDWIVDRQLDRSKVNGKTADILRKRMEQCRRLIYVASAKATVSKWMPWELGFFDGKKGEDAVAILPLVERQGDSFLGQEYLELYAVVQKGTYSDGSRDVFVEKAGRHWQPLRTYGSANAWRSYGAG
jgi:hypothetical protein